MMATLSSLSMYVLSIYVCVFFVTQMYKYIMLDLLNIVCIHKIVDMYYAKDILAEYRALK